MTVFLWKHKLSYVTVPKVACTSVKTMLFEAENGRPFRLFRANGRAFHIRLVYPTLSFDRLPRGRIADHARLALVRDPIRRFLSSYANRVVHHCELSEHKAGEALAARGLPADPDLDTYVDRFEQYREAVISIAHHAAPMVAFLGRDPGYHAAICPVEKAGDFVDVLSGRLGRALCRPRLQTGGPQIDRSALSPPQLARLERFFEEDYRIYGNWLCA